jgi:hypothetical protein
MLSTLYLSLKYSIDEVTIGVVKGDQQVSRKLTIKSLCVWTILRRYPSYAFSKFYSTTTPRRPRHGSHDQSSGKDKYEQCDWPT